MAAQIQYPHLTIDAANVARIGDTRFKVIHLAAEHYHHGWSAEELLCQHPDLRPEQIYAALTYFYDHREAMIAEMEDSATDFDVARAAQSLTRDELLQRRAQVKQRSQTNDNWRGKHSLAWSRFARWVRASARWSTTWNLSLSAWTPAN